MRYLVLVVILLILNHESGSAQVREKERIGLLVMAHGGNPKWNQAVLDAVAPLENDQPTTVAFGMANRKALQQAVNELEDQKISRINVVRLFMSSESFLHSTEYVFGLRDDPPVANHDSTSAEQLELSVPVSISRSGLMDALVLGEILADRARGLSSAPSTESLLIVGHGPGDDTENATWIQSMNSLADQVRAAAPFHKVLVNTLREDWTDKREIVEEELRSFLRVEEAEGRTVLIIPFRLYGFGPYADVFDGLAYRADSLGFLPDPRISTWIKNQYLLLSGAKSDSDPAAPDSLFN